MRKECRKVIKRDYRIRTSPLERKVKAQNVIRETLTRGDKRFTDLLIDTGLSRPALSSNLKELEKKGEVKSRISTHDLRVKIYSLTEKGMNAYKKQKDIERLNFFKHFPSSVGEFIQGLSTVFQDFMEAYGYAIHHAYPDDKLSPVKKEAENIIEKCITFSFYFEEDLIEGENPYEVFRQTLKEFVQAAILAVSSPADINIDRLKHLRNLLFVFKLDREKLIDECQRRKKLLH